MCATSIAVGVGTPELARRGDKSVAERYLSSGLPFFSAVIGMNEHWTTLTWRLLVEHGWHPAREFRDIRLLAVTTARGGLDHAPVSRRCSNISQNGPSTEHTRLSCSRLSAAPQLRARKVGIFYLSQI